MRKGQALLACGLSLLLPGLGQYYKGHIRKAFLFFLICLGGIYLASIGGMPDSASGFFTLFFGGVVLELLNLTDAVFTRSELIHQGWYNRWWACAALFLAAGSLMNFFVPDYRRDHYEAFKLPSKSNEPTLRQGDRFIVSKKYYRSHGVARGDFVIFSLPDDPKTQKDESEVRVIKRVVALGGEKVEVRGQEVIVDGKPLAEPYAQWTESGKYGNFGPVTVPKGEYFVLGDNRDMSRDSRFYDYPFIPRKAILGKAMYIYYSSADFGRAGQEIR